MSFQTNHAAPSRSEAPTTVPTAIPATVPTEVPLSFEGTSVTVALEGGCDDVKLVGIEVV